jgi:ABC-2 type transport system permease protein
MRTPLEQSRRTRTERSRRMWSVFRKSVREQKRDLMVLGLSLAFAPLFVVLYWLMTGGTGSTAYGVLVINNDVSVTLANGSSLSAGQDIIRGMEGLTYKNGSPLLRVSRVVDRAEAETQLRNRGAAILIVIPPDFSRVIRAMLEGSEPITTSVTFVGDLTNPYYTIAAVTTMMVADNYIQAASPQPRLVQMVETPLGASAARTEFENYVPGLFVLSVILLVFQASMTVAREIEGGTLLRLQLTRVTSFELLGGITAWLVVVAVAEVLVTFVTAWACGFHSQGPLWVAVAVGIITSFSIIGVGMIVASFSKTVSQAFVIANFPLGFFMFLTGAAFPLPRYTLFTIAGHAVGPTDVLPPTHAVVALNKVLTLGAGLGDVIYELAALLVLSALYFAIGVWLFKRTHLKAQ